MDPCVRTTRADLSTIGKQDNTNSTKNHFRRHHLVTCKTISFLVSRSYWRRHAWNRIWRDPFNNLMHDTWYDSLSRNNSYVLSHSKRTTVPRTFHDTSASEECRTHGIFLCFLLYESAIAADRDGISANTSNKKLLILYLIVSTYARARAHETVSGLVSWWPWLLWWTRAQSVTHDGVPMVRHSYSITFPLTS
jgi:hypothetical protein